MAESLRPAEKALVNDIVRHNQKMMERGDDAIAPFRRAQHPKHHGCVGASFVVAGDVPLELRHGVFTKPDRRFAALIRFSNGRAQEDTKPDAHGMAVKLLDVDGERLEGLEWQTSQDFVLVDDELFFSGRLDEYEVINRIIAEGRESLAAQLLPKALTPLVTALKLKLATRRDGKDGGRDEENADIIEALRAFAGQRPASPLASHYWSTTPYRLGTDTVVKYMVVSSRAHEKPPGQGGRDYLAEALARDLQRDASFDFMVHVQGDPDLHPVDDPQVSWSHNGARCIRLARIEIPAQQIEDRSARAERVVMSPWNCLQAHEPLGKINLARRQVYLELAEKRLNGFANLQDWANVPLDQR